MKEEPVQGSDFRKFEAFMGICLEDLADCIVESLRNLNSISRTIQIVSGGQKTKDAFSELLGVVLPPIA